MHYKQFHCLHLKNIAYTVYNVRSQLQRSKVTCEQSFLVSYSLERLLYDAERDQLTMAKFLVGYILSIMSPHLFACRYFYCYPFYNGALHANGLILYRIQWSFEHYRLWSVYAYCKPTYLFMRLASSATHNGYCEINYTHTQYLANWSSLYTLSFPEDEDPRGQAAKRH